MKLLEFAKNLCNSSRKQYDFQKQWNDIPYDPNVEPNLSFIMKVNYNHRDWQREAFEVLRLIQFRCRAEMKAGKTEGIFKMMVSVRPEHVLLITMYRTAGVEIEHSYEIGKGMKDEKGNSVKVEDLFPVPDESHEGKCVFCAAKKEKCCNPDFLFLNYRPYCDENDNHPPFPFSHYYHHHQQHQQQQQPSFLPPPPSFQLGGGYNNNNYGGQQIQQPLLLPAPPPPPPPHGWAQPQPARQGEPYYYRNQEEYSACSIM